MHVYMYVCVCACVCVQDQGLLPHAMEFDPATGELFAVGLAGHLEPFIFSMTPPTFKLKVKGYGLRFMG